MRKTVMVAAAVVILVTVAIAVVVAFMPKTPEHAIRLSSTAFSEGGAIPSKYTADGANVSPPLSIENVPEGTVSLALIADDPDAPGGTWVHWVVWNIPASTTSIPEGVPTTGTVESLGGAKQGTNDFGNTGYGGPDPPSGPAHRYYFRLYALDTNLDLSAGASKSQLVDAMQGHIIDETSLMGTYGR